MEYGTEGKRILVIFDDGGDHPSRKEGFCTGANEIEISINNKHYIPRKQIIRIEVIGSNNE